MSTKIYNGFILNVNPLSFHEVTQCYKVVRTEMVKVFKREIFPKYIMEEILHVINNEHLTFEKLVTLLKNQFKHTNRFNPNKKDTILNFAYQVLEAKQYEESLTSERKFYDLQCTVAFIAIKDKILGLHYFNDNFEYEKAFNKLPFIQNYDYWDNSDPLESVSEKDWKQREKDWEEALPLATAPSEVGLIGEIVKGSHFYDFYSYSRTEEFKNLILDNFPSIQGLAERKARKQIIIEKSDNGNSYSTISNAIDYVNTEEGIKEIEERAKILLSQFPIIDESFLSKPIGSFLVKKD
jgi:hypothetical protein